MSKLLERLQHYARLIRWDKPVGTLLLLWPTLAAVWIAGQGHPSPLIVFVFIMGVLVMRSAGCVINDIWDRDLDPHVKRTQGRPIAAGDVSVKEALLLTGFLLLMAFCLVLLTNFLTFLWALYALALAVAYPLMKRIIALPQLVLGLAFNGGIILAFTAQLNQVPPEAWLLFLAVALWTVAYDTLYAMVDREDDIKIGIQSTAVFLGQNDRVVVGMLHTTVLALLFILGQELGFGMGYYAGLIACALSFMYQHSLIRHRDPRACFQAFNNNQWSLLFFFLGVMLSY